MTGAIFRWVFMGLGSLLVSGCLADPDDARMNVPGDYLGTFEVNAILAETSCGNGALGAPGTWDFSVQLSKDGRYLYWTNGTESIRGDLSKDGKVFGFTSELSVTLREAKPGRPGCVIWRQDVANGTLDNGDESVEGFSGKLIYTYAPGTGSECGDLFDEYGLTQLPCTIRFDMVGAREDD